MILYITRKFHPSVGGMQRFNFKLTTNLRLLTEVCLIKWGGEQWFLPFFFVSAFFRALFAAATQKITCIYVSDGVLSPLGLVLKWILRKPAVVNIHGRDIAFDMKLYQAVIPWCLRRIDKVICVSGHLKEECVKRGVAANRLHVIPNGVDVQDFDIAVQPEHKDRLEALMGAPIAGRKIIVTVGRLVAKKGADSFIMNILPHLKKIYPDFIYLLVGDGPLEEKIKTLVKEGSWENTVYPIGPVSMDGGMLPVIYKMAHVFAMPNVRVHGDMEGFGIVAIEAGASGLPVVATRVDGITEAVKDGENGFLVEEKDYDSFAQKLAQLLRDEPARQAAGERAEKFVEKNYSWREIAKRYLEQFEAAAK
ncbi:MAG TPA: hypothetical protein DE315_01025 [Candidatus Omnitrophica bacterium]|nr:hypothetical protein [Candidatus Omnitrophota bacterium]